MHCDSCEIKNLLYQYADYLDAGEMDNMAAMFAHAQVIGVASDGSESISEGKDAVLATYGQFTRLYPDLSRPSGATPGTKHMTSNVIVDVDESGLTASSKAYAVVFQSVEGFPLQPIIAVRYADKFEKVDGKWRFCQRKIHSDLFGDLSQHLLKPM